MKIEVPKNLHSQVEKAQQSLLLIAAVATIISVFSLMSAWALLKQGTYQSHVLSVRHKALKQLNDNVTAANQLVNQYNVVLQNSGPINVIGGKNDKSATAVPPDGDNARIILDALPSSYDFPALVTSLSKVLTNDNISNPSVGGSDSATTNTSADNSLPQPVTIDVPITGTTSYAGLQKLMNDLQRSTRPFDITNLQLSGSVNTMTFSLQMQTYYQPAKTLSVPTKVVAK